MHRFKSDHINGVFWTGRCLTCGQRYGWHERRKEA